MELTAGVMLAIAMALAAGLVLGAMLATLRARRAQAVLETEVVRLETRLAGDDAIERERIATLGQAEERLAAAFDRLAGETLSRNSENFLRLAQENLGRHQEKARAELTEREKAVADLVTPIREALEKTTRQIGDIEKERHAAYGS